MDKVASNPVESVFDAWQNGKSALLYGPPGTGKTRILSELRRILETPEAALGQIGADPSDARNPFKSIAEMSSVAGSGLPKPVKTIWLTFHQSLGYDDFVIGLRPDIIDGLPVLVPTAGALLEAVLELQKAGEAGSVVFFIDEINRGNAAKIFGEFLTFLDFEYRETDAHGVLNPNRVPLPVRHLQHSGNSYEPLRRGDGSSARLAYPSFFPRHIYVVATMNSVDRTAIPIDSALARRFDRIDIRPELHLLARTWSIEVDDLFERAKIPSQLTAGEVAILILDRINLAIAENFGTDFELGHGLFLQIKINEEDSWLQLERVWDRVIFPQIEDRFSGRPEELASVLRVEEFAGTGYAWRYRQSITGQSNSLVLEPVSLAEIRPELAKSSLQLLASRSQIE